MEPLFNPFEYEDVDSVEVQIRRPGSGDPTGATVTLMGPVHPRRREIDFAIARRASKRMLDAISRGRNAHEQLDPEEEFEQETDKLAKYTLGWTGFAGEDGKPLDFSIAAARKLYSSPKLQWLRTQIKIAADDSERFTRRSAAS